MKRKHFILGAVGIIVAAGVSIFAVRRTNLVEHIKGLEFWGTVKTYAQEKFDIRDDETEDGEEEASAKEWNEFMDRVWEAETTSMTLTPEMNDYNVFYDAISESGKMVVREDGTGLALLHLVGGREVPSVTFYTKDYGETWTKYPGNVQICPCDMAISEDKAIATNSCGPAESVSLYYSPDFGKTFEPSLVSVWGKAVEPLYAEAIDGKWILGWKDYSEWCDSTYSGTVREFECVEVYDTDMNYVETFYADADSLIPYIHAVRNREEQSIFPTSNEEKLRKKDIVNQINVICEQNTALKPEVILRLAINEIYARKKYDFTNTKYEIYFRNMDWYSTDGYVVTEAELTAAERANIDTMVALEDQKVFCK